MRDAYGKMLTKVIDWRDEAVLGRILSALC